VTGAGHFWCDTKIYLFRDPVTGEVREISPELAQMFNTTREARLYVVAIDEEEGTATLSSDGSTG
jgi:hypothetical protein